MYPLPRDQVHITKLNKTLSGFRPWKQNYMLLNRMELGNLHLFQLENNQAIQNGCTLLSITKMVLLIVLKRGYNRLKELIIIIASPWLLKLLQ